ncbi:MAG TPA: BrnT family toxin [Rhodopseudomonas sp.]|uniref:BrnT family toxin n=1 Tax=Rhodopseudomonas sp. TaxID=1078 RepID=UPI002ED89694
MVSTISFDPAKRLWTLHHRGLDFATDASKVFAGRTVTKVDDRFDYGEVRYITAGHVEGRMVVMVWTERGASRHVISMRHCHGKEEARWNALLGQIPDLR